MYFKCLILIKSYLSISMPRCSKQLLPMAFCTMRFAFKLCLGQKKTEGSREAPKQNVEKTRFASTHVHTILWYIISIIPTFRWCGRVGKTCPVELSGFPVFQKYIRKFLEKRNMVSTEQRRRQQQPPRQRRAPPPPPQQQQSKLNCCVPFIPTSVLGIPHVVARS